jgi:heavy metal efflux system protein
MLAEIIRFSIRNKALVGLMTVGLIAWGGWSLTQLPIDAVPDITDNQVQVLTVAPSQSASDIERLVTFPVEQTMATIPGIQQMRSFSRFGLSVVTLVFKEDVQVYWARQQVSERLVEAKALIPAGVGSPSMAPVTTGLGEIYQYTVRALPGYEKKYDAMELRTIQDWIVRRQLLGVEGVADVSSFGGYLKQYEVALNPQHLRAMNVSISEVFDALAHNNENTGGAYIDKQPNAWFIRSEGLIDSLQDIGKIVVKQNASGLPVLLRDVAKIGFGHAVRYGAMTRNDDGEVVGAIVMMLKGANSSVVIENVKERIAQIEKNLPEGIVIEPYLDRTKLVDKAISTVTRNLVEGALIVIFVLVLLLGNLRGGLIVASVIPLAMLFAIAMMHLFGVSGNLMSLGAIDFGLIVDGAVIIVEATLHHLAHNRVGERLSQEEMDLEVHRSASKIMTSAAFGEIIILIVYLPILALVGVEGKMFKPMAETVAFAIAGAFILSLTYVPMISALVLNKNVRPKRNISDRLIDFIQKLYRPSLKLALRFRWVVLGCSVVGLGLGIWLFTFLGAEFIPTLDEGDFAVETRVLTGSSMQVTVEKATQSAKVIQDNFPEVKAVIGKIGSSEIPLDPMPVEACDLMLILKDKSEWTSAATRDELAEKIHAKLKEQIAGVTWGFQQPIQMRFNELMSGARQDVVVKLYGENLDTLAKFAGEIGHLAGSVEGAKDLYVEQVTGLSEIVVDYKRDRISQNGLNVSDLNLALNTAFAGQSAGMVYEGERRFDLVVRLDQGSRKSLEDVRNLLVTTPMGNQVPLSQLAEVDFKVGPNQIQRDDAKRRIIIGFNVRGRDVESVVNELQAKVDDELKFPPGYYVTYGGTFKNLMEARERLMIAVPLALLLIFLLLFFTFNSFTQSLLIFTAIPLSAVGGIVALWSRGMPFSISAGVGFIALFGVAVLNGIVLISEFNRLRESGMEDLREIVLKGTATRLRPVIMTAAVASLGFLPMAISNSEGAEVQRPLATVVIGGLVTATLLTLILLPCLYMIFQKVEKKNTTNAVATVALVALLLLPALGQGQNISRDQAVKLALQNNLNIKENDWQIIQQHDMVGTASELPRFHASWMYGQYNTVKRDNNITLSQTIPFPTVIGLKQQVEESKLQQSILQKAVTKNEVEWQVKAIWTTLQYYATRAAQLQRQDSLFAVLERTSTLRYATGEGTLLEKTAVNTQRSEIAQAILRNERERQVSLEALNLWMGGEQRLLTFTDTLSLQADFTQREEAVVTTDAPQLAVLHQEVVTAGKEVVLQKNLALPDISLGYFNQSLIGTQVVNGTDVFFGPNYRFQGFTLGLSVPVWTRPELKRIDASRANWEASKLAYAQSELELRTAIHQAEATYRQQAQHLEWFRQTALPNAALLTNQAQRAFEAGEIDYATQFLHLRQAADIAHNYLLALHDLNQTVLKLDYLYGNSRG